MDISHYFPVWGQMNSEEQHLLTASAFRRHVDKGTILHNGSSHPVNLTPHKRLSCLRSR